MATKHTYIMVPNETVEHLESLPEMHPLAGLAHLIRGMDDSDKQFFMYALTRNTGVSCEREHTDYLINRWLDALDGAAASAS